MLFLPKPRKIHLVIFARVEMKVDYLSLCYRGSDNPTFIWFCDCLNKASRLSCNYQDLCVLLLLLSSVCVCSSLMPLGTRGSYAARPPLVQDFHCHAYGFSSGFKHPRISWRLLACVQLIALLSFPELARNVGKGSEGERV